VCFGSLSCIKWWLFSYSGRWSVGRRATCRICTYIGASIMPSKTHAPCHPIPANTCTSTGCFAQGFGWGRLPFFPQQNLLWHSTIAVRSFHLTAQHPLWQSSWRWAQAHSSRFSLFAWQISWQYLVQPSSRRPCGMVISDSNLWSCRSKYERIWTSVASSSACIVSSMVFRRAPVRKVGLPDPFRLSTPPVSS